MACPHCYELYDFSATLGILYLASGVEAEKLVGVSALDMFEAADDEAMCCSILMHRYLNLEICIDT
ncbi:unnamed protein product [Coffea canephora]|uniref:Uncharacterized protein n=1 Tax=Coffea canephora TaxID=49390 RepID=A0A068U496_COFCA|nr:unnamed protein product [Coffea canephora]